MEEPAITFLGNTSGLKMTSIGNPYISVDTRDVQDPDHDRRIIMPVSTQPDPTFK